jgi:hypothetical protein
MRNGLKYLEGSVAGFCYDGDEFLHQLNNIQPLKEDIFSVGQSASQSGAPSRGVKLTTHL